MFTDMAVARILINYLLAFSLVLGVSPISAVALYEQSERSAEPETPLEREEATARPGASRAAPKRAGKPTLADLPRILIPISAAPKSVRSQSMPFAIPPRSQQNLHQVLGVFRI
jgi:hypothetical protein